MSRLVTISSYDSSQKVALCQLSNPVSLLLSAMVVGAALFIIVTGTLLGLGVLVSSLEGPASEQVSDLIYPLSL